MSAEDGYWDAARTLCTLKGNRAISYVDERIGFLSIIRDDAGVERFRQIRSHLQVLLTADNVSKDN